jgi:hypothetical protein
MTAKRTAKRILRREAPTARRTKTIIRIAVNKVAIIKITIIKIKVIKIKMTTMNAVKVTTTKTLVPR